jgi:hypothetical protein
MTSNPKHIITGTIADRCPHGGKICWPSHGKAFNYAKRVKSVYRNRLRVYKCPECGWWHTTTDLDGSKKKRK